MRKSKKVIFAVLLAVVVLVGSTVGVVIAQTGDGDESQPKTLLSRVSEILDIEQQTLENAFAQAQSEMRAEALDRYLLKAVERGKMTQEEADQYKSWWQARPDTSLSGRFGAYSFRGGMKWGRGYHFQGWQHRSPYQATPTPES